MASLPSSLLPYLAAILVASACLVSLASAQNASRAAAAVPVCDVTAGSWLPAKVTPRYGGSCKGIRSFENCIKNGRKEFGFINWVWKPKTCTIPAFDPNRFLLKYRNKMVGVAGDSFSSNFEDAIHCLVASVTPITVGKFPVGKFMVSGFKAARFNVTFLHLNTQFMVAAVDPKGTGASSNQWIVDLDVPERGWSSVLPNLALFVFNTGHWFINAKPPQRIFKIKGKVVNLNVQQAMQTALATVGKYMNTIGYKGQAVFVTFSPFHYANSYADKKRSCLGATKPFTPTEAAYAFTFSDGLPSRNAQVAALKLYPRIQILDITKLSILRPDAHVQTFTGNGKLDCSHWCIPGLPDTWANMLYKIIMGL